MYDNIDDILTDLKAATKTYDGVIFEFNRKVFNLRMKVTLNKRSKYLSFDLPKGKIDLQ